MKKLLWLLFLCISIFSCTPPFKKVNKVEESTKKISATSFSEPILIDSSGSIMYLLSIEENKSLKSYGEQSTYWNIVFYNSYNNTYHLLDEKRKMLILNHQFSRYQTSNGPSAIQNLGYANHYILYSIKTKDFNKDGLLNNEDPTYLFISDKQGKNFRQLSPNDVSVNYWKVIEDSNSLIFSVRIDTDNDKLFTDKDDVRPMSYNLKKNEEAVFIFKDDFKKKLAGLYHKQWADNN